MAGVASVSWTEEVLVRRRKKRGALVREEEGEKERRHVLPNNRDGLAVDSFKRRTFPLPLRG